MTIVKEENGLEDKLARNQEIGYKFEW